MSTPSTVTDARGGARLPGLDGIRAIAVLMVLWHNYGPLPGFARFSELASMRAGYVGVTAFFVLSGFLITHLLLDEFDTSGGVRIRSFWVRRAARLLPPLLLTLCLLTAINVDRGIAWSDTGKAIAAALLYVFNFALAASGPNDPLGGGGWSHLWSLSVEEQFYIAWPIALGALVRRVDRARLVQVILAAVVVLSLWRTLLWWNGASDQRLYLWTDMRIDAILLGCAIAVARRQLPAIREAAARRSGLLLPALIAFVALGVLGSHESALREPGWLLGPGMLLASALSGLIVVLTIDAPSGLGSRLLQSRLFDHIGRRSYGIYLFHVPVASLISDHGGGGWLGAFVATLVVAELSYRFVEVPVLRRTPTWARRRSD